MKVIQISVVLIILALVGSCMADTLTLPSSATAKSTSTLFSVTNNGTGGGIYALTVGGDRAIFGENRKINGFAIYGLSNNGTNAAGVYGISVAGRGVVGVSTTGPGIQGVTTSGDSGVCGQCKGATGAGVLGIAENGTTSKGVLGRNKAGFGVYGSSVSGVGVYGTSNTGSAGKFLINNALSSANALDAETYGTGMGIFASNSGTDGGAGYFANFSENNEHPVLTAMAYGPGNALFGYSDGSGAVIKGRSDGAGAAGEFLIANLNSSANAVSTETNGSGAALAAINDGTGLGGIFQISGTTNTKPAIQAQTMGTGKAGYFWIRNTQSGSAAVDGLTQGSGPGVLGETTGSGNAVLGITSGSGDAICGSTTGAGAAISGKTTSTGSAGSFTIDNMGSSSPAVIVRNNGGGPGIRLLNPGTSWGALFQITNSTNELPTFQAETQGTGGAGHFWVRNSSSEAAAVHAWNDGKGPAVMGETSTGTAAVMGINIGSGYAGYFGGRVRITNDLDVNGTVTKATGSFKIDHPLDPENKYLYHSFVESPDMMNVYNGNVVLDDNGEAYVQLPDYFEALNKDYRYQLTCIGGFAPVYIAEEISGNTFKIAGGTAGIKVSWQVTGIRQDVYAKAHPIVVEQNKPAEEKGTYLHPELYTEK